MFGIGEDDPRDVGTLTDVDVLGTECHEPSDLRAVVLALVRGDIEVHAILRRLGVVDRHEIEVGEQPAGVVQA